MSGTMLAAKKVKKGSGFELLDENIPEIKEDNVLIRVLRTSICGTDVHIYRWDEWAENRIVPPLIFGHEGCGEVVGIGPSVKSIRIGDFISAETHISCNFCYQCRTGNQHICKNLKILGVDTDGVFAQYALIPERVCWKNHKNFNPDFASIMEPFGNAVYVVMESSVTTKDVLILGDGPIAAFATGISKAAGAGRIFLTGLSKRRLDICKKMGANKVINVNSDDPIELIMEETSGEGVDVVLEMSGAESAILQGFELLKKGGTFTAFGVTKNNLIKIPLNNGIVFKAAKIIGINGRKLFETWYQAQSFLENGLVDPSPVITDHYPLEELGLAFEKLTAKELNSSKIILNPWRS